MILVISMTGRIGRSRAGVFKGRAGEFHDTKDRSVH